MQLHTGRMFLLTDKILPMYLCDKYLKVIVSNYVCVCIHRTKPASQNKEDSTFDPMIISNDF